MAQIDIRFTPEMEKLVISGGKICTTRLHQKGDVGDVFVTGGSVFRLVYIGFYSLSYIASDFYLFEGFSCPDDFIRFWDSLSGYPAFSDAKDVLFPVHFFARLGLCRDFCGDGL